MVQEDNSVGAKIQKMDTLENILIDFNFIKVLNENALNKLLIIQAEKKESKPDENRNAVIIFEKAHFDIDEVKSYLKISNSMDLYINNDAYKKLCIYPNHPYNSKKTFLLAPT